MRRFILVTLVSLVVGASLASAQKSFTLVTDPREATVKPGQTAHFHVEVVPNGGYTATVNFHIYGIDLAGAPSQYAPGSRNFPYTGGFNFNVTPTTMHVGRKTVVAEGWNGSLFVRDTVYINIAEGPGGEGWLKFRTTNSRIPEDNLTAIDLDRNGVGWIGTAQGRVIQFDKTLWTIHNFATSGSDTGSDLTFGSVRSVLVDRGDRVWAGFDRGARKFDGAWSVVSSPGTSLSGLRSIVEAADGALWFAVNGVGLLKLDAGGWHKITPATTGMPAVGIERVGVEPGGNPWIVGGAIATYDGSFWSTFSPNELGLAAYPTAFDNDLHGALWAGSSDGISKLEGINRTAQRFPTGMGNANVNDMDFDGQGNLWIATNAGLFMYDFVKLKQFTTENSGIPANFVSGVRVDRKGIVWVTTNYGLGLYASGMVADLDDRAISTGTTRMLHGLAPQPVTES